MKVFTKIMRALFFVVGLLALFAPYEFERKENGDFSYRAWLLGIDGKTDDQKKRKVKVWFFNKPKLKGVKLCSRKAKDDFANDEDFDDLSDSIGDGLSDLADSMGGEE